MAARTLFALALPALVLGIVGVATGARAQDAPSPAADAPAEPAPSPSSAAASSPSAAPSAGPGAPRTSGAVTGYAYHPQRGPAPPATPRASHLPHHEGLASVRVSGFEMLGDGGSRVFVELSAEVTVTPASRSTHAQPPRAKRRGGKRGPVETERLVYVLQGAELARTNDENALETRDFDTPVLRARMVPSGRDVRLEVVLRADVTPAMKIVPARDHGAILQIDFPPGSYVAHPPPIEPDGATPSTEQVEEPSPAGARAEPTKPQ